MTNALTAALLERHGPREDDGAELRPVPYRARVVPTAFLDARTAGGVTTDGRTVPALVKRDAGLSHYLRAARAAGVERVYLVGDKRSAPGWLFAPVEGWRPDAHYVDAHGLDVARMLHEAGGRVEVRRAAEWFGWHAHSPRVLARAWDALGAAVRRGFGSDAHLLASPVATGQDTWARTLPRDKPAPPVLSDELQELLRATSCQHHIEAVPRSGQVPGFVYLDGRFMFAALTRELGCGPVTRDAVDTAGGYERARYRVTATVPRDWPFLGILPVQTAPGVWEWPREPGRTFDTWADGAETKLARDWGWTVTVHERLLFGRGRPLDTWTERLLRAREHAEGWSQLAAREGDDQAAQVGELVAGALRAMLVQTIGGFHSTGRPATRVSFDAWDAPDPDTVTGWKQHPNGVTTWLEPRPVSGRQRAFQHPEWSAQVWSRGHVRILDHRGTGVLHAHPDAVLGVFGDAVYLTEDYDWPVTGRVGELRVKGALSGPLPAPASLADLHALRARAEAAGAR